MHERQAVSQKDKGLRADWGYVDADVKTHRQRPVRFLFLSVSANLTNSVAERVVHLLAKCRAGTAALRRALRHFG